MVIGGPGEPTLFLTFATKKDLPACSGAGAPNDPGLRPFNCHIDQAPEKSL